MRVREKIMSEPVKNIQASLWKTPLLIRFLQAPSYVFHRLGPCGVERYYNMAGSQTRSHLLWGVTGNPQFSQYEWNLPENSQCGVKPLLACAANALEGAPNLETSWISFESVSCQIHPCIGRFFPTTLKCQWVWNKIIFEACEHMPKVSPNFWVLWLAFSNKDWLEMNVPF